MSPTARHLRDHQTRAERAMWSLLRNGRCGGLKFHRQHSIQRYVVDFFCDRLRLIVEVDGKIHDQDDQVLKDAERTAYLQNLGYHLIRFSNEQVLLEPSRVAEAILAEARLARGGGPHPPA